ncbi:hypothetical protein F2S88_27655 [Pseudomonas syringae pv. actinidiae]|nr:hypothetical protein [Pseudomonas syringae pv. actinidiae]
MQGDDQLAFLKDVGSDMYIQGFGIFHNGVQFDFIETDLLRMAASAESSKM